MKYYAVIVVLLLVFKSNAQSPYFPSYDNLDATKLSIYKSNDNYQEYLNNGQKNTDLSRQNFQDFCELTAYVKKMMVTKGNVYQNFNGSEQYLQTILDQILESNNIDIDLNIVLVRSTATNAFVMHGNDMFVTMGLLAAVENESQLAFILAHELSHVIKSDPIKGFERSILLRGKKYSKDALGHAIKNMEYSRRQETAADSFAIYSVKQAGYLHKNIPKLFTYVISVDSMYNFIDNDRSLDYVKDNVADTTNALERLLRSHPESFKRASFIDSILTNFGEIKHRTNSNEFIKIREFARYELLYLTLIEGDYLKGIDKAFRYHLNAPSNPTYIYYMAEAMRRKMYVDDEFGSDIFLNVLYKKLLEEGESVLRHPELLVQSHEQLKQVSKHPLFASFEESHFKADKTNLDVFNEMIKIGRELKIDEIEFCAGLYSMTAEKDNTTLITYSLLKSVHYKDFAKKVLNKEHSEQKKGKQLVLIDNLYFAKEKNYGFAILLKESEEKSSDFNIYLSEFSQRELSQFDVVTVSEMIRDDYGKFLEISDASRALKSIYGEYDMDIEADGPTDEVVFAYDDDDEIDEEEEKFDLFVLCPELWYIYHKYNLKSVDEISGLSLDTKSNGLWIWKLIYPPAIYTNIIGGSILNSYFIERTTINPFNKKTPFANTEAEVNYKINKYYYTNTFYHLILEDL